MINLLNKTSVSKLCVVIFIFVLLFYVKTINYKIVKLRDDSYITTNYPLNSKLTNLLVPFSKPSSNSTFYRPLVDSTFVISTQISGFRPWGHHLFNVLLHSIVVVLSFLFFLNLGYQKTHSFFFSLVFALHPIVTGTVAWLAGRTESLVALFILLSILMFMQYLKSKSLKHLFFHLLFFIFAVFSKETGLISVFACLILLCSQKFSFKQNRKNLMLLVFSWVNILLFWLWLRSIYLIQIPKWWDHQSLDYIYIIYSFFKNTPVLFITLGKIIYPNQFSLILTVPDSSIVVGLICLAVLSVALLLNKQIDWRKILFGTMLFTFPLVFSWFVQNKEAPTNSNPITGAWYFFENRSYLPLIGFNVVILELVNKYVITYKKSILMLVYLAFIAGITFSYANKYQSQLVFWENTQEYSPSLFTSLTQ